MAAHTAILTLNAGSSSLKFGLFRSGGAGPVCLARGQYRDLGPGTRFELRDDQGAPLVQGGVAAASHEQALNHLLDLLPTRFPGASVRFAGHRVVHGGPAFQAPVRVDGAVLRALRALIPLAPLHMPHNLAAIEILARQRPDLGQVACFDTAFHHTLPRVEQYYALPRAWFERGVRRYGFHGLSYEYIAAVLPRHLGEGADGRVVVAHLGHGASLCALHRRRSVATTMGFTPLDGIPMATRPGALDPGIVPWLLREAGFSLDEVDDLLNHHCGLLGLSGTSGDMRTLLAESDPRAAEAVDHFVHHTGRAIASMAAALGGIDALVFTAGIGENSPVIRERICRRAGWLGIELDPAANAANASGIATAHSRVSVWRIPTDEERTIAAHTQRLAAG